MTVSEVGDWIRTTREQRGVSRRELADLSGLSYPYLQQVEAGTRSPSPKSLAMVAHALGEPVDRLLSLSEEHAPLARRESTDSYLYAGAAAYGRSSAGASFEEAVAAALDALRALEPSRRLDAAGVVLARVLGESRRR